MKFTQSDEPDLPIWLQYILHAALLAVEMGGDLLDRARGAARRAICAVIGHRFYAVPFAQHYVDIDGARWASFHPDRWCRRCQSPVIQRPVSS